MLFVHFSRERRKFRSNIAKRSVKTQGVAITVPISFVFRRSSDSTPTLPFRADPLGSFVALFRETFAGRAEENLNNSASPATGRDLE